jgi:Leucine-rich repeat (LRR) protein
MEKGLTTLKTKQLTSLYVNGCTALEYLDCEDDYQLISLIVSGCTALHELNCYNNQLTSLDVSSCTALHELSCYNNQLTSLNVSGCMALAYLDCDDNQLTTAALNTVFTALPDRATGFYSSIYIYNNPGTGTCNRAIAENKGWSVSYH